MPWNLKLISCFPTLNTKMKRSWTYRFELPVDFDHKFQVALVPRCTDNYPKDNCPRIIAPRTISPWMVPPELLLPGQLPWTVNVPEQNCPLDNCPPENCPPPRWFPSDYCPWTITHRIIVRRMVSLKIIAPEQFPPWTRWTVATKENCLSDDLLPAWLPIGQLTPGKFVPKENWAKDKLHPK